MGPIREPVSVSTRYYCLPGDWLKRWQQFATGNTMNLPPMIDNSPLIDKITADIVLVKKELTPSTDYEIIPEIAWNHFVTWYVRIEANFRTRFEVRPFSQTLDAQHCVLLLSKNYISILIIAFLRNYHILTHHFAS